MPLNETSNTTVQYTVTTTNTADGTVLYWKTTGNTNNSDIVGGNTGSITITNNQAVFNVSMNTDLITDGTKTLGIAVSTGSQNGPIVVTTPSPIVIEDTAQLPFTVEYLVQSGGGGSGAAGEIYYKGAAGGGLSLSSTTSLNKGTQYTVTVGAGGIGSSNGSSSVFATVTSNPGIGSRDGAFNGIYVAGDNYSDSGGGGAGTAQNGSNAFGQFQFGSFRRYGGNGGNGTQSSISGTSTYYGGGGGGGKGSGGQTYASGYGGLGGGGRGQGTDYNYLDGPFTGEVNTGGGAGGAFFSGGTSGGSGIVIVRTIDTEATATTTGSPQFTNAGGYKIYKFTGSGTITFN